MAFVPLKKYFHLSMSRVPPRIFYSSAVFFVGVPKKPSGFLGWFLCVAMVDTYRAKASVRPPGWWCLFYIVHLGYLSGAVTEEVGYLFGRYGYDRAVGLFNSVYEVGGESVT